MDTTKALIIDGKIVKCRSYIELDDNYKIILGELGTPKTMTDLIQILEGKCVQSTISRKLHDLYNQGLISYTLVNGKEKHWKLLKEVKK